MIFDLGSMVGVEDVLDNERMKPEMFTDLLDDIGLEQARHVDPAYGGRIHPVQDFLGARGRHLSEG
ncbi:MAG: hypothetical protein MZV70_57300 [Desulfobacterales bacterium]|nr:hypothetical protein [Desulfobacterales bacterium]